MQRHFEIGGDRKSLRSADKFRPSYSSSLFECGTQERAIVAHTTSFIINLFFRRFPHLWRVFIFAYASLVPPFAADIADEMLSVSICLARLDGTVIQAGVCARVCVRQYT